MASIDSKCWRFQSQYGIIPTGRAHPNLRVSWAMQNPYECPHGVRLPTKALAFDSGPPTVCDGPAASYDGASDEHGRLGISGATNRLGVGDKFASDPRPLRPDGQPLRLVRLHPQQPRRAALADHRPRRGLLDCPTPFLSQPRWKMAPTRSSSGRDVGPRAPAITYLVNLAR